MTDHQQTAWPAGSFCATVPRSNQRIVHLRMYIRHWARDCLFCAPLNDDAGDDDCRTNGHHFILHEIEVGYEPAAPGPLCERRMVLLSVPFRVFLGEAWDSGAWYTGPLKIVIPVQT